jgi:hypothetical protein
MVQSEFLDGGELVINDRVLANFRITGVEPFVDMLGHVDLRVPGVGDFTFAAPFSLADLTAEAGCVP